MLSAVGAAPSTSIMFSCSAAAMISSNVSSTAGVAVGVAVAAVVVSLTVCGWLIDPLRSLLLFLAAALFRISSMRVSSGATPT